MMYSISRTLFVAAAMTLAAGTPADAHAQSGRSRLDTTFAFGKNGAVDLGLISGEIAVTGWTRPEIKIIAVAGGRATLETSLSNSRVSINQRGRRGNDDDTRFELMVPVGTRVTANSISGDIRLKATVGEVDISTVSGDIELIDATDRITINTTSGDVRASKLRGRLRIEGVSSEINIEDATGDVNAKTVSGEITMRGVKSSSVRAETVSGEITYEGAVSSGGNYEFNAHSGEIHLDIPANSSANLALQTWSGGISSQFPMTMQTEDIGRRSKRKVFTIGNGGATINVETFSGDITIQRSGRSSKE